MALSIIEEKDKIIESLMKRLKENKIDDEILELKEEIPQLSPEWSQYPEWSNETSGGTQILNSQRMSYMLAKKLKEINPGNDLFISHEKIKRQVEKPIQK